LFLILKTKNYIFPIIIAVAVILGAWLFSSVLIYLIISLVLFLIGSPLTTAIEKIKIGGKRINDGIASLATLIIIFGVFSLFFVLILPPLIQQVSFMSELNFYDVLHGILNQYPSLNYLFSYLGSEETIKSTINEQFNSVFNFGNVSSILNNLISYLSGFIGGLFCVLFITFFLLKDQYTASRTILLLTPPKIEEQVKEILTTSKKMLSKYFIGLIIDVLIVGVLAGTSLWILGIKNALIIGFVAGLFNVVPYIGPMITLCFALFLGVSGCIEVGQYDQISSVITKIFIALMSINILDALFFQPFIFSNTVKAHPLEIFLVVLMAGTLAGIGGMVVAIPVYTLVRIVAKEFLTQFKFFRKITEKITD
jgi:predicted PurR-regulated permease PerM